MPNKSNIVLVGVGEPWDFEGPDGKNRIKGKITKIINDETVIFKSNHIQKFDEGSGDLFIFSARHVDEKLVHKDSQGRIFYKGTFGAGLIKDTNYLDKDVKIIEKNSIYVFIGSVGY
jgi:hypothetical protein